MPRNGKFPDVDGVNGETINVNVMGFCNDYLSYLKLFKMLLFFYTGVWHNSDRKFIKFDRRLNLGIII